MLGEDIPSEVLLETTLGSSEFDQLGDELNRVDQRRLRNLVWERVFGEAPDNLEIGRYVVLERLGSGGMGVVFSAYDQELDRKVAIKLLHEPKDDNPQHHSRLLREAQTLARLSHPNVVQVHDVGESGGQVFVAMEFVAGKTLREWVRQRPRSTREIVDAYIQAGRGLEAAHRAGIVHRDFKPDNVLIDEDGRVRVLDFGIARAEPGEATRGDQARPEAEAEAEPALPLTRTGALLGTPAYMAPEQHLGDAADMRSDQFAFCVSLHESLHRTRPFAGDSYAELADNVIAGQQVELEGSASSPRWLRELLARGLSADPAQRFPDMSALLRELSRDRVAGRRRWALGATSLTLVGVAALFVAELERDHETEAATMASELELEGQRADGAERELRGREDAVTIAEAALLVPESPVEALAKLRELHDDHAFAGAAWVIASDARQRGFPRSISRWPADLSLDRVSADGRRALLIDGQSRELHVFDVLTQATIATSLVVEEGPISISGDGRFVAVRASDDGSAIQLWEVDERVSTRIEVPTTGWITRLQLSPDGGRVVAFASVEDGRSGWLLERGGGARALPEGSVHAKFVPQSADLLLTDGEAVLRRFDPETGALSTIMSGAGGTIAISPDGAQVVAEVRDWDAPRVLVAALDGSDARAPASFEFADDFIYTLAWHPNSDAFAIGGSAGSVSVVSLDGERRIDLPQHRQPIARLAFSPDGSHLASASRGGSVFVTRLSDGHAEAQPGHRSMGWVVYDDEGQLRTVDGEGVLRLWDPAPRQRVRPGPGLRADYLDWSSRGLLAAASSFELTVVSADEGEVLWTTKEHSPYEGLAWSDAGDQLASLHGDGALRIWSREGALEQTVTTEAGEGGDLRWLGERVAWGEAGVGVHLLEPESGERELIPIPNATRIVALEPDPQRHRLWVGISSGAQIGSVLAFDDPSWAPSAKRALDADGLTDLATIPGRDELVYATSFGDVVLLDAETGARRRLGAHEDHVHTVKVDALGHTAYTASLDGSARVWDLDSGRWREVRADEQSFSSLARSPDGGAFVTGQGGGELVIWPDDLPRAWDDLRGWIDELSPAPL
ncbi:WD40 repeat domain-containing serine/threonine protein kinase [Enhygromyxa salina]|uniref:WD40 repeat domain-containing serine/threonine protein kinase n=1 Tax=Enhygromyxa salina TaxID=215803 RepID=UPI001C639FE2|nr:serine/threonine-protein kinase [Enhygromyxa salina]